MDSLRRMVLKQVLEELASEGEEGSDVVLDVDHLGQQCIPLLLLDIALPENADWSVRVFAANVNACLAVEHLLVVEACLLLADVPYLVSVAAGALLQILSHLIHAQSMSTGDLVL